MAHTEINGEVALKRRKVKDIHGDWLSDGCMRNIDPPRLDFFITMFPRTKLMICSELLNENLTANGKARCKPASTVG